MSVRYLLSHRMYRTVVPISELFLCELGELFGFAIGGDRHGPPDSLFGVQVPATDSATTMQAVPQGWISPPSADRYPPPRQCPLRNRLRVICPTPEVTPRTYEDSEQESCGEKRCLASGCERGTKTRPVGDHRRIPAGAVGGSSYRCWTTRRLRRPGGTQGGSGSSMNCHHDPRRIL